MTYKLKAGVDFTHCKQDGCYRYCIDCDKEQREVCEKEQEKEA